MGTKTQNNIIFNNVKELGSILLSTPAGMPQTNDIKEQGGVINAVDIDWNGAKVESDKFINTTGELLNWIKSRSNGTNAEYYTLNPVSEKAIVDKNSTLSLNFSYEIIHVNGDTREFMESSANAYHVRFNSDMSFTYTDFTYGVISSFSAPTYMSNYHKQQDKPKCFRIELVYGSGETLEVLERKIIPIQFDAAATLEITDEITEQLNGIQGSTGSFDESILNDYAKKSWVTENEYAKESWVREQISGIQGGSGIVGPTGPKGDTGISITNIEQYYLATSSKEVNYTDSSRGWQTTPWNALDSYSLTNKYLWNYEKITYSDGSYYRSYPVIISVWGATGATGATGPIGPQGAKGDKGDKGEGAKNYTIILSSGDQTPEVGSITEHTYTLPDWDDSYIGSTITIIFMGYDDWEMTAPLVSAPDTTNFFKADNLNFGSTSIETIPMPVQCGSRIIRATYIGHYDWIIETPVFNE